MKVSNLMIENFKVIRRIELVPEGELIVIGGKNGQGKTSVLDALMYALTGSKPSISEPVRRGEQKAEVVVQTDNGLTIRQYMTAEGTYGIRVQAADGMVAAQPHAFLERLAGKLNFDPGEFVRLPKYEQGEALRRVVGLDFKRQDDARRALFETRTGINREGDMYAQQLQRMPPHDPSLPDEEPSVADLLQELSSATSGNQEIQSATETASLAARDVKRAEDDLERAKHAYAEALTRDGEAKRRVAVAPEWVSVDAIRQRIASAQDVQRAVRANLERRRVAWMHEERLEESRALSDDIHRIDEEKRKAIAAAHMPVPGLSFSDDGAVTYRSLPFLQASAAEQLRVAAAIGLAMQPELRVLLIRDASLLDDDSLAVLQQLAEDHDAQIFLERVGTEGAQFVLIDGELQPDNPAERDPTGVEL